MSLYRIRGTKREIGLKYTVTDGIMPRYVTDTISHYVLARTKEYKIFSFGLRSNNRFTDRWYEEELDGKYTT